MRPDEIRRGDSSNLDFLRTVAVSMVLFDHILRHYGKDRIGPFDVNNVGLFGVLLFFVHTSLVLMYSMERSRLTGSALFKNFYIRRFFRIYPLSIVAVLSAVALHLHAAGRGIDFGPRPQALELFSNLFLIQNLTYSNSVIGPLWSLPIEVQMYLVLPFLFLWRKRSVGWLLFLWAGTLVLGHLPQVVPALGWFTLLLYMPNFLPGIIAFSLPEKPIIPSYLWPPLLLLIGVLYASSGSRRLGAELCLLLGVLIPLFGEITFRPLKLVSHHVAKYSYGIYLAHSFCIWYGLTGHHSWLLFSLMMVALPLVLYHGIEHPGIRLGMRLAKNAVVPPAQTLPLAA
jgi:peptidoglycan/LPS O-acetylase OafA/YrhL